MNQIFCERSTPIKTQVRIWNEEAESVYTDNLQVYVETTAHYDAELAVLVVDQDVVISPDYLRSDIHWSLPDRRTLETHNTSASATRRAVALADEYSDMLAGTVYDDQRTDEQVHAAWSKRYGLPF